MEESNVLLLIDYRDSPSNFISDSFDSLFLSGYGEDDIRIFSAASSLSLPRLRNSRE